MVRRSRQGYTLFEVVLVLALLVLLAAITYPSLDAMYGDSKVTAAGDMVRGAWAEAQARAMDEGRAYRFAVIPNQGNYRVAPDSADFWSGNG
ncbi:MAG: prepilin-type N-terminal cleavage/methylation domain-containing protein [Planctomycetota bacterium]|nr:MAG: prepilin-type N-terminal cleavage/methylation domain-containing protein [Planctomycetota bacterium]